MEFSGWEWGWEYDPRRDEKGELGLDSEGALSASPWSLDFILLGMTSLSSCSSRIFVFGERANQQSQTKSVILEPISPLGFAVLNFLQTFC